MISNKRIIQQQSNVNKRDFIASPTTFSKDLQNENVENEDGVASGSGSGTDETGEEASEINQSNDTENLDDQSESTQNSIDQSAASRKDNINQSESTQNSIDQSADSTKKNTITTEKLHLLQKINEQKTEQQMIARNLEREKAVNFAKFFRDGTTGVVSGAQSKRNQIAVKTLQSSSIRPSSAVAAVEGYGRRNLISYQQVIPSVDEIFKRDRIQIHKNLAKLSAKYKDSNPLLKDLSKFTSDDAPNPIWKKFLHDAKSAVAITKRQNLLGYMFKPSTTASSNNNNKGAMFVAGNHLYKKVCFKFHY